jgi:hypothetical protein
METYYGLSPADLLAVQEKIDRQKKYLQDTTFLTESGQVKSLLDVSFSANHSERYYAQLVNKINTMTDYASFVGYSPFFLTMTLDGFWRDLLHRNDSTRFMALYAEYIEMKDKAMTKKDRERFEYLRNTVRKIPDNDVYGYIRSKIFNGDQLTVKDLYNVLNYQMKLFMASPSFVAMRKKGLKPIYVRTAEPHEDGVPHLHAMFYFPKEYRSFVLRDFKKAFPAPRNSEPLVVDGVECADGQVNGFIWNISKPAGYVLKYVTKSFINVKNQKNIDYIQAWYVKHRIIRSVTSHSVLPQWAYQKLYPIEKDWYYLTDLIDRGVSEWSREDDYIRITDVDSGRSLQYDRGEYKIFYDDVLVKSFGEKKETSYTMKKFEDIPKKWHSRSGDLHRITVNGQEMFYRKIVDRRAKQGNHLYTAHFIKPRVPAGSMKDIELMNYYMSLDIDYVNMDHFVYVKNELIDRGLLNDERLPMAQYSSDEFGF